MRALRQAALALLAAGWLSACGSGGGTGSSTSSTSGSACTTPASTPQFISAQEVEQVIAQGAEAAAKLGAKATIAVVDRAGNVLALYRISGAGTTVNIQGAGARDSA